MNPPLSHGGYARQSWYEVACCPPNIMRTLASLGQYLVTQDGTGLQIHLYNSTDVRAELSGQAVKLEMNTDYPWTGQVTITVNETPNFPWPLCLRVPNRSQDATVALNGKSVEEPIIESGYVVLERVWKVGDIVELTLPIEPFAVEANPRVDAVRGTVAIQRGPLVYCLEAADNPDTNLLDVQLDETAPLLSSRQEELLPGGVMTVQASGFIAESDEWQNRLYRRVSSESYPSLKPVSLTAIPYYAWANRGAGEMRVWLPRAKTLEGD